MTDARSPQLIAAHLAMAIDDHVRRLRRNNRTVPGELEVLVGLFTGWAAGGTARPVLPTRLEPRVLTYAQVGEALGGVSTDTVRRLVKRGELPAVRVSGTPMVRTTDLDGYLDQLDTTADTGNQAQADATSPQAGDDLHDDRHDPDAPAA